MNLICIAGTPGAGKSTLAHDLSMEKDIPFFSSGDIARTVDPEAMKRGDLAQEDKFHLAFDRVIEGYEHTTVKTLVIDGFPRTPGQWDYIALHKRALIVLYCKPEVARQRILARRRGDDLTVDKRIKEQNDLLGLPAWDGWAGWMVGVENIIDTTPLSPFQVVQRVLEQWPLMPI